MYENKWKKYGNEYHSSAVTFDTVELEHVSLYMIKKWDDKGTRYGAYKFDKETNAYTLLVLTRGLKTIKKHVDLDYDKIPKIATDEETGMRYGSYSK